MISQITIKNSPLWKTDPDQQLAYYSGRSWVRRYKPEMLLGIYDVDEMEGVRVGPEAARDVTPRKSGFAAKALGAREKPPEEPSETDATKMPDSSVADAEVVHWTESVNPQDGFPGAEAFTQGAHD
ncbi:recombinase RecT, partial [Corallococcus praedator]